LQHISMYVSTLFSNTMCKQLSVWSSGMIPALGAGGPGFNPPNRPVRFDVFDETFVHRAFGLLTNG
jgi:hypothetical protein